MSKFNNPFQEKIENHLLKYKAEHQYLPPTSRKEWYYQDIGDNLFPPIKHGFLRPSRFTRVRQSTGGSRPDGSPDPTGPANGAGEYWHVPSSATPRPIRSGCASEGVSTVKARSVARSGRG